MVLRAFDRGTKLPDDPRTLEVKYRTLLNGKRILILADDARKPEQVRPLLPPAGCALLITSRWRFTLPGMIPVDLDTLPPEKAETLLCTICPRIDGAASRLAELCGYLYCEWFRV
jgi:hypothetical protein